MSETKLLPCPFCAAEAVEYAGGSQGFPNSFGIVCVSCGAAVEDNKDGAHVQKWNDRAVNPDTAALEKAQAKVERLTVRGIEDMIFRIEQLEAALTRIREISVESGAHNTVAFCDLAMKGSQIARKHRESCGSNISGLSDDCDCDKPLIVEDTK